MNPNAQFERDLEQWLHAEAPASAPAGFHASVMDRARTMRQRPGWTRTFPARRFGRGRGIPLLAAAALLGGAALAAGAGILRLPTFVPPVPEPSVIAVATSSPDASVPSPSESAAPSASPMPVAGPGGAWIATGSMVTPRSGHAALQLLDGRVLIVGGTEDASDPEPTSAELYDPASGTWSATASMLKPRYGFPPTRLLDGRVLVGDSDDPAADVVTIGSEVYDPESGTWSSAGKVSTSERFVADGSTATLLRDGKVLVSGASGAQLYDPDSGTWSATGTMITPRHNHTATLLRDGKVLVAGGRDSSARSCDPVGCGYHPAGEAELYDPDTGSWTAIANLQVVDEGWATLLQDGTLLVMSDSAELYDPTSRVWTTLPAPPERGNPVALLPDDSVLLAVEGEGCTAAALYDHRTGSVTSTSSMIRCVSKIGSVPSFTSLRDGTVLVAGGPVCNDDESVCMATGAAELYVPAGVALPPFDFPTPPPNEFPSPTPRPTPLAPAAGPVPPNARSWTITVDNQSSEPAALFVADEGSDGLRLVGSATPNAVPAGTTMEVTFLFPADGGWIYVNPRPGEGGSLVNAADIGIPGKIWIRPEGDAGWVSP